MMASVAASSGGLGKRISEWFWQRETLAALRQSSPHVSERAQAFAERARTSADVARLVLTPAEPLQASGEAIASELFRQSAYWSACALSSLTTEDVARNGYTEAIWESVDQGSLVHAAGGSAGVSRLHEALTKGSFVYFAELSREEQQLACAELSALATALLMKIDEPKRKLTTIFWQRVWRVGLAFALVLAAASGFSWVQQERELRSDLALGKAWRASSRFENAGCTSPNQQCPESTGYFFHTQSDTNPWVEFDLGADQRFSTVQVDNRPDCCPDRAVPLVVEVSNDRAKWQGVARRDAVFSTWRATFAPVKARWVRLRVEKESFLHLSRVRIFP
jgi:hypothetical protein